MTQYLQCIKKKKQERKREKGRHRKRESERKDGREKKKKKKMVFFLQWYLALKSRILGSRSNCVTMYHNVIP